MSDQNEQDAGKSRLSLRPGGRLELGKTVDAGSVRQSFSHGRSKTVQVEVVKKRAVAPSPVRPGIGVPAARSLGPAPAAPAPAAAPPPAAKAPSPPAAAPAPAPAATPAPSPAKAAPAAPPPEAAPAAPPPAAPVPAAPAAAAAPPAVAPSSGRVAMAPPASTRGGAAAARPAGGGGRSGAGGQAARTTSTGRPLTQAELAMRQRVLEENRRVEAQRQREDRERQALMVRSAAEEAARRAEEEARAKEDSARRAEEEARMAAEVARRPAPAPAPQAAAAPAAAPGRAPAGAPARKPTPSEPPVKLTLKARVPTDDDEDGPRRPAARRPGSAAGPAKRLAPAPVKKSPPGADRRREGRIDVAAALEGEDERTRSIASVRRARERERRQQELARLRSGTERVVREVVVPESITVQELANRMAARGGEVVKTLFRMGVMATLTQSIDADTAELVVQEFGHRVKRVSESDVEIGLEGAEDTDTELLPRPPVVTIMGHVDHGKTSLLDALRKTDVVAHEAGGITQHIGAYQITVPAGDRVTFIDTPGHEAFTAMRARGASVTDMVVLVVAADDGVMPQTVEAIRHARAAKVPLIVAVNKIDKPGVKPERVKQELLQHEIVVESLGGETQEIEVSATQKINLDKLLEAISLQAEILDLRANPDRAAEGTVIESKLDRGRGPVATVLVQKGTLKQGDIVVAGAEWGRVRAMLDDKGRQLKDAGPSLPVEILGLSGVPTAGENFIAVENEARAREISEFRQRKLREKATATAGAGRGSLTDMLARIQAGEQKEVAVVVKADVQGSSEAIGVTLGKLGNDEVRVRVLHSAVGQITESDIQLAKASDAVIVAFNVRATSQARDLAQREGVEIRYYSIIYEVADDIEKLVKGKLAPVQREKFLGYAQILQVFEVKRIGKVAGCRITEGQVKRGAGVRLLRDGVVIHQGELSTLRRFKDDVREVGNGLECGMSFANYDDIRVGDQIECYETETVAG
ncbi:MAG: translation initiation factor IF-2 [Roseomonas sp.]|nr:translation initiation factor IF-2 [Roseomonas sp.]MCA3326788.1 translation initiation factor IF-2 [Roseomonas sp.]MCA3330123.1 translation initiation factor IF-2 [Roseomonas sp.]MCA3333785.1 translation initiation factor IF-2 [Roseomonas sp.]MCA3353291.1 translation initiation factor IF-2 [Roseomonas sp.]